MSVRLGLSVIREMQVKNEIPFLICQSSKNEKDW